METTIQARGGRVPMPDDLSGVSHCRRWLRRQLEAMALPGALVADVELIASELVANAFVHGSHPRSLWLRVLRGRLRVSVSDGSPEVPNPRSPAVSETRGRGLRVVAALAQRWGTARGARGKSVWAELTVPASTTTGVRWLPKG